MLDPLKEVFDLAKIKLDKAVIDDIIFRLHYRATFIMLMASSLLVTQRKFIGQHIKCIVDAPIPENVINTYCFFSGTFTAVKHLNETALDARYLPHPGVGPVEDGDELIDHDYYQWVPFVLFLQALMFYVPHYLWRKKEAGRLKLLVAGLRMAHYSGYDEDVKSNDVVVVPSKKNIDDKISTINTEFSKRLHAWRSWSVWLVSCEVLNLLNLLFQIYVTDVFLGGQFIGIGKEVWNNPTWDDYLDPLDVVFPKVAKCTYHKYGPSGDIQNHDSLCIMTLNVIHEKIYTILWFWYVIVLILTGLGLIHRIIIAIFHGRSLDFNVYMFKTACPGQHNRLHLKEIMKKCYFGDWLFVYFLARNMNINVFTMFLEKLYESFSDSKREPFNSSPLINKDGDSDSEKDSKSFNI